MKVLINVRYKSQKVRIITEEELSALNQAAIGFLIRCREVICRGNGPWIYGDAPTALDAHLVAFMQRMKDAGHFDYFDDRLMKYLDFATSAPEWKSVMQGKQTLPQEITVEIPKSWSSS